jgi:hypothetical protein
MGRIWFAKLTEASLEEVDTPASRDPPVPPAAEVAVVPP